MVTPTWEEVKKFYQDTFGIDSWAVEVMANLDILVLCASGASNKSISIFTDIGCDEVSGVIKQTFSFDGWEENLPINPYSMYKEFIHSTLPYSTSMYVVQIRQLLLPYPSFRHLDAEFIFTLCKTMDEIESRIYEEWI